MTKLALCISIALLTAATVAASTNTSQESGPITRGQDKNAAAAQAAAKKIYLRDCAICHGENGKGLTDLAHDMQLQLADWTDPKTLAGKQDEDLFNLIRNGKDKMPPEAEDRAKDNEVRNLIQYIRDFSKPQTPAANSGN